MQFWVVASRAMKNNLRNPLKTLVMISISVFFALLIGSIYYQVRCCCAEFSPGEMIPRVR